LCIRERVVKTTTIEEHQRGEDFDATENDVPVVVIIIAEASVLVKTARAKRCRCRMSSFLAPSFSPYYALKKWKEKIHPLLLYLGF
jgi:hypothetical protein